MENLCGSNGDRISDLPHDMMQLILRFLPVKDAARTATLSKQWRQNWRANTRLAFDRDFSRLSEEELGEWDASEVLLVEIFEVLLLHDGPITKFELTIPGLTPSPDILDLMMLYLSKKDVQEIVLYLGHDLDDYGCPEIVGKIPSSLFFARQLNCLNLLACEFTVPSGFLGFSKLTRLQLSYVIVSSNFYDDFLPKCPLLQSLVLHICGSAAVESHIKAELVAPCLKMLETNVWNICFKYTPVLSVVWIEGWTGPNPMDGISGVSIPQFFHPDVAALFASLPAIQKLIVGSEWMQFLASGDVPFMLPTHLHQLKVVELGSIILHRLQEARVLVCLIMSSPNLQKITIWSSYAIGLPQTEAIDSLHLLLEAEDRSTASCLQCLEELRLDAIQGTQVELDLLRFVLATAPRLRRFFIKRAKELHSKKGQKFLKEVTRYKRASKVAEVTYISDDKI